MMTEERKKAWHTAIDLLSRRNHSTAEMRAKLKKRGFNVDDIEAVLKVCRKENYIDDDATAEMWIRNSIRKGLGPFRIRQVLKQKGLNPAAVDCYFHNHPDAPQPLDTARQVLQRKKSNFSREKNPQKRQQKMYRFLYNRGFSSEVIARAIQSANLEDAQS